MIKIAIITIVMAVGTIFEISVFTNKNDLIPTPTPTVTQEPTQTPAQTPTDEQITAVAKVSQPEPTPTPIPTPVPAPAPVYVQVTIPTPTPTLTPTPMPTEIPTPEPSKASLEVFGVYDPNALTKEYQSTPNPDVEAGQYVQLGLLVIDDAGNPVKTAEVVITTPDETQNKTLNGTGSYDKNRNAYYYAFYYEFHTAGDHAITFTANGMTKTVVLKAK